MPDPEIYKPSQLPITVFKTILIDISRIIIHNYFSRVQLLFKMQFIKILAALTASAALGAAGPTDARDDICDPNAIDCGVC